MVAPRMQQDRFLIAASSSSVISRKGAKNAKFAMYLYDLCVLCAFARNAFSYASDRLDGDIHLLVAAFDADFHGVPRLDEACRRVGVSDGIGPTTVERQQAIARLEPRGRRSAAGAHVLDRNAGFFVAVFL